VSTPNSQFPTSKSALHAVTRRFFFEQAYFGLGGLALASLLDPAVASAAQSERLRSGQAAAGALASLHHPAKAKRVIHLFMAGAPSQLDLFDYKPELTKHDGQAIPKSSSRTSASPSRVKSCWPACSRSASTASRARRSRAAAVDVEVAIDRHHPVDAHDAVQPAPAIREHRPR
jgi:hypothetical protein